MADILYERLSPAAILGSAEKLALFLEQKYWGARPSPLNDGERQVLVDVVRRGFLRNISINLKSGGHIICYVSPQGVDGFAVYLDVGKDHCTCFLIDGKFTIGYYHDKD